MRLFAIKSSELAFIERCTFVCVCPDYTGVTHEFFGTGAVVDKAKQAVSEAAAGLRAGFAGRPVR